MDLIVIRHTETQSNVNYIVAGRSDEQLTPNGIKQAEELKEQLQKIDYDIIITSPVYRALQTAQIVNYKNIPIIQDERITDRDPGDLLFKDRNLVNKTEWNSLTTLKTKDGAETLLSLLNRTRDFVNNIKLKYADKTVLVVTHNSISRTLWMLHAQKNISLEELNSYYHKNKDIIIYKNY